MDAPLRNVRTRQFAAALTAGCVRTMPLSLDAAGSISFSRFVLRGGAEHATHR